MNFKTTTFLALLGFGLVACGGDAPTGDEATRSNAPSDAENPTEIVEPEAAPTPPAPTITKYTLDADASKIEWERTLDQKPTEQTIQFGKGTINLNLGDVKMTTEGKFKPNEGFINDEDGVWKNGEVDFSVTTLRIDDTEGGLDDLFHVKEYPNSLLTIKEIEEGSREDNYTIKGDMRMGKETKDVEFNATITKEEDGSYKFKGKYVMDMVDWGFRPKVKAEDIRQDDVEIDMRFIFK